MKNKEIKQKIIEIFKKKRWRVLWINENEEYDGEEDLKEVATQILELFPDREEYRGWEGWQKKKATKTSMGSYYNKSKKRG